MKYRFLICEECDSTHPLAAKLSQKLCEINASDATDKLSQFAFGRYLKNHQIETDFDESSLAGFKSSIAFFDKKGKRFFSVTYAEVLPAHF